MTLYLAILQVALPLTMIFWLSIGAPASRGDLLSRIAAAWLLLFGVAVAGVWLAMPISTVTVLAALMLLACIAASLQFRRKRNHGRRLAVWGGRIAVLAALAFGTWAAVPAVAGWREPASLIDLAFPFREGRYLVANGGAAERINAHFITLEPRHRRWRGESYAIDLVRIDAAGFRTEGRQLFAMPRDPSAYLTYGTRVYAPCSGVVEAVVSDRPDMPVPKRDRENLEGNFVLMRCGASLVLLAHLRRNSVFVRPGEWLRRGQVLGAVGNSGNSDEPHLHLHVQKRGTAEAPFGGEPLHVSFHNRFLVRNMIVRAETMSQ